MSALPIIVKDVTRGLSRSHITNILHKGYFHSGNHVFRQIDKFYFPEIEPKKRSLAISFFTYQRHGIVTTVHQTTDPYALWEKVKLSQNTLGEHLGFLVTEPRHHYSKLNTLERLYDLGFRLAIFNKLEVNELHRRTQPLPIEDTPCS